MVKTQHRPEYSDAHLDNPRIFLRRAVTPIDVFIPTCIGFMGFLSLVYLGLWILHVPQRSDKSEFPIRPNLSRPLCVHQEMNASWCVGIFLGQIRQNDRSHLGVFASQE